MKKVKIEPVRHPWSPIHDVSMELTGVEKSLTSMESEDAGGTERITAAGSPLNDIHTEAVELTRLVQGGRRVTREDMLAIDQKVRGPRGFLRQ